MMMIKNNNNNNNNNKIIIINKIGKAAAANLKRVTTMTFASMSGKQFLAVSGNLYQTPEQQRISYLLGGQTRSMLARIRWALFSFLYLFLLLQSCLGKGVPIKKDVVVVGAGLAGLAAARKLALHNISCAVFEASDRVGGRTRNWDTKTGNYDTITKDVVEIGGTFISPSHTSLIRLGKALGFETYNVSLNAKYRLREQSLNRAKSDINVNEPAKTWPWWWWGEDFDIKNNSRSLKSVFHSYNGSFEFSSPDELLNKLDQNTVKDLHSVGIAMDEATQSLKSCESISEPGWEDYDAITFEGWIRSHTKHEESRVILRNMCRGMIASEPAQVSFLSIVKSMKGCWSEGDDDQYRLKGGSQAITLQIQKNNLFPIKLNTPVDKIVRDENTGLFAINEGEVEAKYVIVTGTPAAIAKITFIPLLDHNNIQLLQRMPMGQSMKFFVVYDTVVAKRIAL